MSNPFPQALQYNYISGTLHSQVLIAKNKIQTNMITPHNSPYVNILGKLQVNGDLFVTGNIVGSANMVPVINSVLVSDISPKTTIDISNTLASESSYHVVYIFNSGSANLLFSDQTPANAAPTFSINRTTVTFANYEIKKHDHVVHAFYSTSDIKQGILLTYIEYIYQCFTFVRPGPYSGPYSIPWNGMGWDYNFTVISDRTVITSAQDAIEYVNNEYLTFNNGVFTGLMLSIYGIINDIECYTTPHPDAMVTKWRIDYDDYYEIDMDINSSHNWTISWGDANNTTDNDDYFDSYDGPGEYYVTIYANKLTEPMTSWEPDTDNLLDVLHWGDIGLQKLNIRDSENARKISADDIPATTITDMSYMFNDCNQIECDVSNWDVSNVTNMSYMFEDCHIINPDVSNWDVSNVTNMSYMFDEAYLANPDVSNWDVSNVTDMTHMFSDTNIANPDVSNWNVSNVTTMDDMFHDTRNANPDVSNWNVSNVTNMSGMFSDSDIANPDVSNWNVSNVTNMSNMFSDADSANPNVSNWNVSNVTDMSNMFNYALVANPNVSNWNVSNVQSVTYMFANTPLATPNITNWNVSNIYYLTGMFSDSLLANPDFSQWNVLPSSTSNFREINYMFYNATSANPNVSGWNVSSVYSSAYMFYNALVANPNISSWILSSINNAYSTNNMFSSAPAFSSTNYDIALNVIDTYHTNVDVWETIVPTRSITASGVAYGSLIGKGWFITDGGTTA